MPSEVNRPVANLRPTEGRLFLRENELDAGVALIRAAHKQLEISANNVMKAAGLAQGEFDILMGIRANPGSAVHQLRERLAMTVPTFGRLLGRLDRKGCLAKKRSGLDGRAQLLFLSEQGEALVAPLAAVMRDTLRAAYRSAGAEHVAGARAVLEAIQNVEDSHEQ